MSDTISDPAQVIKTINGLIEINRDAQLGYQAAANKITTQHIKAFCLEQSHARARFVEELQPIVLSLGERPGDKGTMTGALRRGWMDLKSTLGGGDHTILVVIEAGEDHAVNEYEKALETSLPLGLMNILERQCSDVDRAHVKVAAIRDSVQHASHT